MQPLATAMLLIGLLVAGTDSPVVLENGKIRLELEPRTFSVRFLGVPGGKNFVDPVHLTDTEIRGDGWLEPGGIVTDLLPAGEGFAPLRRGPADVVEHRDRYALLLGPEDPERRWRFKKEYYVAPDTAEIRYKLTVLSGLKDERDAAVRITAQLPSAGVLLVPGTPGELGLVRGTYPDLAALRGPGSEHYVVPLTPQVARDRAVLSSPALELVVSAPFGRWTRRLAGPEDAPRSKLYVLLDDRTHVYQAAFEVGQGGVNAGAPLVVEEHWTLAPPAAQTVPR